MSNRRNFLRLSAAAAIGVVVSACTKKEIPMGYGTPTPGISTLDDEGLSAIKRTGFARLKFTQLPTDPDMYKLPPKANLGTMIAADEGMPPLTIELIFPGQTITVTTGVMILPQNSDGVITGVQWIKSFDSIDSVRDTLLAEEPAYGFDVKKIHDWHRDETQSPSDGFVITNGKGLGVPIDVEAMTTDSGVNLWYSAMLDSESFTPSEIEHALTFPEAEVMNTVARIPDSPRN